MPEKVDRRHDNSGRYPYTEAKAGSRQRLIQARLEAGMSQEDVANQIGCNQSMYSLIENGYRSGRNYRAKLSMLFSMPETELMEVIYGEPDWSNMIYRRFTEVK